MDTSQFASVLTQIDDKAYEVKYDLQIADLFQKALEENTGRMTPEQEQQLQWESLLFRLRTKNRFDAGGLRTERFAPMVTFTNGDVFPDPNSFPESALDNFERRAETSTNPITKARYLDFLWEKSKSKQRHRFASKAIEEYLLTVDAYEHDDAILEQLDSLQRATDLSLILEGKKEHKPLTESVVLKLNQQIDEIAKTTDYRWLLELFELVRALHQFYSKDQITEYIRLSEGAAHQYHADQKFNLQRSFLEVKAKLTTLVDRHATTRSIDYAIGQSFIDEAEAKSDSNIVKVHFLNLAIQQFSKLGDKAKVEQLTAKVKASTAQAIGQNEFKTISIPVEIKKDDIDKLKESLGEGEAVPQSIGTHPTFFPNWDWAVQTTEKQSKEFVFSQLFGKVTYSKKYPISVPQTPAQEQEDRVMDNYQIDVDWKLYLLTKVLQELIADRKVSVSGFKDFFTKLKTVDEDTYDTVCEGLDSYFNNEHFQAAHILTLQLEDFLRQLLALFGGQTTIPSSGAFREKTLGTILSELRPYISEPVYRYISYVMTGYKGFNLRNNIAHGFFKKKHGSPVYSSAVLHIFCLLIANTTIVVK